MNYKEVIKAQLEEFQSNGFGRTFTPIYRKKDTFPFTEIDFSQESKYEEKFNSISNHLRAGGPDKAAKEILALLN